MDSVRYVSRSMAACQVGGRMPEPGKYCMLYIYIYVHICIYIYINMDSIRYVRSWMHHVSCTLRRNLEATSDDETILVMGTTTMYVPSMGA